ncbi:hypothetical protein V8C34DRAFT_276337 [Trichoderma compactum]
MLYIGWNLSRLIYSIIHEILMSLPPYFVYTIINQIGSVPIQCPTSIRFFQKLSSCAPQRLVFHGDL